MDLTYATIIVLASMMFVLSGMVGYLYWQHTRLQQSIQSLAIVVSTIVNPPPAPAPVAEEEDEEDDRVSVAPAPASVPEPAPKSDPEPETATSEAEVDVDDLHTKTASQLRELLEAKGIPYGKRDSKTTLIELLKATA